MSRFSKAQPGFSQKEKHLGEVEFPQEKEDATHTFIFDWAKKVSPDGELDDELLEDLNRMRHYSLKRASLAY